jgi:hypothetical protein
LTYQKKKPKASYAGDTFLERDALEHVITRPYRKCNKPFENGHSFRENES